MKKILLIPAIAVMIAASGCSTPHQFSDLNNVQGLTQVYTSSALLKLTGGIASKLSGIDFNDALKNAASVRVIIAEDNSASKKARSVVSYQLRKMGAQPLLETSGTNIGKDASGIYVTPSGPDTFSNVVIVTDFSSKFNAIFLEGNITLNDIKSLNLE